MASPQVQRRSRLLVHRRVQGWLMLRVLVYLGCAALFVTVSLVLWQLAARGPARWNHNHLRDIWNQYAPVFIAVGLLIPFFVYDVLRFSHRFMGPLYRLHRSLQALGRGEAVEPLRFREGDMLHEMAEAFNQVLQRVQQQPTQQEPSGDTLAQQEEPASSSPEQNNQTVTVAADAPKETVAS